MSSRSLEEFMARLEDDEVLRQELQAMGSQSRDPVADIVAFAVSKGYDIAPGDIAAELPERELDAVAGGATMIRRPVPIAGAGAAGLFGFFFPPPNVNPSDRRLKSNIRRVGTHRLGIGIYEYDILGRRERGVMADEVERVRPEAVSTHPFGIKMVDYSRL